MRQFHTLDLKLSEDYHISVGNFVACFGGENDDKNVSIKEYF